MPGHTQPDGSQKESPLRSAIRATTHVGTYTSRQMRRNHAAIGGVVPGYVSAGMHMMLDVRYPTPCTSTPCTPTPNAPKMTTAHGPRPARVICPATRKMPGKSTGSESRESPGHSMPVKPYHAYHAMPRGEVRHAAVRCNTMRHDNGISHHDSLPSASTVAYRRTSQTAAAQPHSAVCSCAPSRSKSAMR